MGAVAGVPVTCTTGNAPAFPAGTTAYQCPTVTGNANVAADVDATAVTPAVPLTTAAGCPAHGLRTCIVVLDPASITATTTRPPWISTLTFELPWM